MYLKNTVQLGYNFMKGTGHCVLLYINVVITEDHNVIINSEVFKVPQITLHYRWGVASTNVIITRPDCTLHIMYIFAST
jgi:hypothetical protein